ncbi:MAG TPA: hypothetical protein VK619_05625 [Pyrinomonadaceae bacterium]|nr:hypothetical protein [Pyrinomonadaceae bacterium]
MSKLLYAVGAIILCLAMASISLAQTTTVTTTTPTTQVTATQNTDGTWTVVEYPVGREVQVNLMPGGTITGLNGTATVLRAADGSTIKLNLTGLPADLTGLNLYAVDPSGAVTLLGPINISNGAGTLTTMTPMSRFMLFASPEADLTTISASTPVIFRSSVPEGFAVIPYAQSGPQGGAPIGERVAATTNAATTPAYSAPLLGIPNFRRGTDTHLSVHFPALADSRANVFIEPRNDGPTTIKMRFHSLKRVPANKRIVLWAVAPDGTFTRLGQVINTGHRNEAQIQTETALADFGLFVTLEDVNEPAQPAGVIYATINK